MTVFNCSFVLLLKFPSAGILFAHMDHSQMTRSTRYMSCSQKMEEYTPPSKSTKT